jgi:hypothetical protein
MARGSGMRIALMAVGQFHRVVLQTPVDIASRTLNPPSQRSIPRLIRCPGPHIEPLSTAPNSPNKTPQCLHPTLPSPTI